MSREYGSIVSLREELEPSRNPAAARGIAITLAGLLLLGGLFWLGLVPKRERETRLREDTARRAAQLPVVTVVRPNKQERPRALTLPGTLRGLEQTTLYARADGYVRELSVDIGDQVKAGQLLAALDDPEITGDIKQARAKLSSSEAALGRARAAHKHALTTLSRYAALGGFTSEEEIEQKRAQVSLDEADVAVAVAARDAQRAQLDRLQETQAFSRIRAPFAGTITARHVSQGALIARGREAPLFELSALDSVRVFVQVPQSRVAGIEPGQRAKLSVAEYPGSEFIGQVTRSAGALDSTTRTMLVEVQVPNEARKLLPGMYGSVTIDVERSSAALVVPASALITGEQGVQVATVDASGVVHLLSVEIERDRGVDVEISRGLSGDESIISNPPPSTTDGSLVRVGGA